MPSSSALCASIGPLFTTSPMAYTFLTLVAKWSSISTKPCLFILTLTLSSSPFVYGRRPTETSSASQSSVSFLPPSRASSSSFTLSPSTVPATTLVLVLTTIFSFFLSAEMSASDASPSRKGEHLGMNSTTVTLLPRRPHTEPISRPMTPPPMTTRCFGTLFIARAPVDDMTFFSSNGRNGSGVGSLPVAMTTFLDSSVSFLPSLPLTSTVVPLPASAPVPL
mmetsp:Transcript_38241/g.118180  ORF Transcript_38241/g.118180 Transcript_38241/m.118180 type:complete len:222 (+) Transcript_38241:536-1201(+)